MDEKSLDILSKKLNALIAINLMVLFEETSIAAYTKKGKKGTGELVNFLAGFGLPAEDIASITGSPVTSVRTLLTPTRRK